MNQTSSRLACALIAVSSLLAVPDSSRAQDAGASPPAATATTAPADPVAVGTSAAEATPTATSLAASDDLTVKLRSGEVLTGKRVPGEYVLTLRDAQGALRAISLSDIVSLTPGMLPAEPPDSMRNDAFSGRAPAHQIGQLGPVKLETEPEGVLLAAEQHDPVIGPVRKLCVSPCTAELEPGRYTFHARGGLRSQPLGMDVVRPGDTVRITVNNRAGLRVGGVLMLALGGAVGGTILSQRRDAEGDVSSARVAGGITAIVLGVGAAITMLVYPSSKTLRVYPARH